MGGLRRQCWSFCQQQTLLVFGLTGMALSFATFLELGQSIAIHTKVTWSPLRLAGYQDWLPVETKTGAILATQAVILTLMYFVSSFRVIEAYSKNKYRLVFPWYTMHGVLLMYQTILIYNYNTLRTTEDTIIIVAGTISNVLIMVATALSVLRWIESTLPLY